jgi:hypothetical protein
MPERLSSRGHAGLIRALDNCDFAALRRTRGGQETGVAGALVVSLVAVEGANGVTLGSWAWVRDLQASRAGYHTSYIAR